MQEYASLASSEEQTEPSNVAEEKLLSFGSSSLSTKRKVCCAAAIIIAIISTIVFFRYVVKLDHKPDTCGTSISEAVSLGCNFDVMSYAWLPPRCFDQELTDQFLSARNWEWYADVNGTQPLKYAAVSTGAYEEVYITQEYHVLHCTYMWRKMHRAILVGKALDGYVADLHHTAHCELQILEGDAGRNMDISSTTIYSKYADCPLKTQNLGGLGWYRMINGQKVHRNA